MAEYIKGDWVSTQFGVGQVTTVSKLKLEVQFGASGPFIKIWKSQVKFATADQIKEATGT